MKESKKKKSQAIKIICTNLNHKCTALKKGLCEMTQGKCVFQQKHEKTTTT